MFSTLVDMCCSPIACAQVLWQEGAAIDVCSFAQSASDSFFRGLCFCWNRCNFYGQTGGIQRELHIVLPWWCHQNQFTQMGIFSEGGDSCSPKNQLYLGKGDDHLLGGRENLSVVLNLQITTTRSFRVTFNVRLWAEGPSCTGSFGFVAALWEAAAMGTVLQTPARRGHFPPRLGCVYWTLSALRWEKENTSFCGDVVAEKSPCSLFLLFLPFCSGFTRCKIQLSAVYTEGECQFSCWRKYQGSDCERKGEMEECHMASTFLYFTPAQLPLLSDHFVDTC